jgi:hypothetical protein
VGVVGTPAVDSSVSATPASDPTQPANPAVPGADTPAHAGDKKTVIVLGVVAVVLITAVAILYFM